jgi:serine/threonine protein kinase
VTGSPGPPDELEAPLPPGTVVDEYVVEELFTRGVSSAIYRSRQPSLDRAVALKLLPRKRSADARWVDRFRRGARALARIAHPNIVPVFGVGSYGGREFLAMLFVEGGKALDAAFRAPKSEAELSGFLKAATGAARALAFVHEQGLVHGDLRPSNILVAPNGHAYLIDFDFASRRGERAHADFDDDRSSGFIPPEYSDAGEGDANPSADVYGLGASLYAALAGGPPRRGYSPPLGDVRADLPKTLCAVVDRCLRPDPRERFESADAVAAALEEALEALLEPGPGRSLGPYEIVSEAGRGGMGVVYRAIERPLGREVALKVLPPEFSALPSRVKRFQREAEAVSKLDHPNIVPIHAFGRFGGHHYFAMKFVRGSTLAAIVERMRGRRRDGLEDDEAFAFEFRSSTAAFDAEAAAAGAAAAAARSASGDAEAPVDAGSDAAADLDASEASGDPAYVEEMTRVFVATARALGYAHDHGILHRDVKPANIMIEDGGRPYVLDFGLAREEKDLALTESAAAIGTPYYMAPEQIKRDPSRPIDRRTDVWGLGVALFETLALRRPFAAPGADELFAEILGSDAPPLRRFNPSASRELEAVVMKALRRDPAERYQDMHAMAADLQATLDGGPVTARPVSTIAAALTRATRHRVPTGAAVLGAFVLAFAVLAAAPFLFDDSGATTESPSPIAPPAPTPSAPKGAAAVLRVFEDPARPEKPAVYAVPAVWFGDERTAVFPAEAAPEVPAGFNERKHGQLIWVVPRAATPISLADPAVFKSGGGIARNLDRLRPALGAAADAAHAAPGLGMCELLPARPGRWIAYKLLGDAPSEGASLDALAAFLPGAFLPARFLEFLVEDVRVERTDEQRGSLQIGPNGVVRAVTPASTQGLGWLVAGVDDRVYGYLRKGGFFASLAEMRGDR